MSAYDWVTRPRDYSSESKESILDIEDATDDHPLLDEEKAEDGGDEVRIFNIYISFFFSTDALT